MDRNSTTNESGKLNNHIVAIAQRQDRQAFAALFNHFAPRIKGFMMRSGVSADAAEDLAQEAMLTVWRKAAYFDPARAGASTWIFTIVRNLRIDGQRRLQRELLHQTATPDDSEPPEQPDEALDMSQRETIVRTALKELPQDQLEVVKLSFVEGKAHGEIAATLNIPLGTVKSRMRLAMVKLRSILGELV